MSINPEKPAALKYTSPGHLLETVLRMFRICCSHMMSLLFPLVLKVLVVMNVLIKHNIIIPANQTQIFTTCLTVSRCAHSGMLKVTWKVKEP